MFKLAIDTLLKDSILFIDNYFTYLKLAVALKDREITIYKTIKANRRDLLDLLIKIKKEFIKNIPYGVLTTIV